MMRGAFAAIVTALALVAAPADAATRFASPTGTGPSGLNQCIQAIPCALEPAVEDPSVVDGDEVVLLPGSYNLGTASLGVSDAITIRPRDAGTRPTITGTNTATTMVVVSDSATLRDLQLVHPLSSGSGIAATLLMSSSGALGERLVVESTNTRTGIGNSQFGCAIQDGTLRDSTCHAVANGSNVFAFAAGASNATAGTHTGNLINVTAVGTATGGGLAGGLNLTVGATNVVQSVLARNVIAIGANASAVSVSANNLSGSSASATLTSSNFPNSTGFNGGTATPAGSGNNQGSGSPPLLANTATGDFHQLSGSPTINAGAADAQLGTQDLDFQARSQGTAPDIGADEFDVVVVPPPPAGDTDPPETRIDSAPKKSVKTKKKKVKVTIGFSADETASFSCSLDGAAPAACSSPFAAKVKKGAHAFEVTAKDAAGNVDPTPATTAWKLKRKRRHH